MSDRVREMQRKAGAMIVLANAGKSVWRVFSGQGSWKYKLLLLVVVAYIISPLDFIPDPIIILGWLDDLLVALVTATLVLVKAKELYAVIKGEQSLPVTATRDVRRGTQDEVPSLDQDRRVIDTVGEPVEEEVPAVSADKKAF